MSLGKKILSNTAWQILGRLITSGLGIVTVKFITNYLPTDVYGQYTTLYQYISFFAIGADFGLYTIGIREMAKKEKSENEILANILSIRTILILFTLSLASIIAQFIPAYQNTFIQSGVWIIALSTAIILLYGTLSSILQYKLKMLYSTLCLVIGKIISVSYIIYTIFFLNPDNIERGFHNLLVAGVIGNATLLLLVIYFVSRETKIYFDFNWSYTKHLVTKALPLGLALILSTVYFKIDVILISILRDYHETGIYGVPLKIMEIISVIPIFFMNSALPSITKAWQKSNNNFIRLLHKSWDFLLLLAVPIMIGGMILAYPLTFLISNPQFLSGYHCTQNIQAVYTLESTAQTECSQIKINPTFLWEKDQAHNYVYLVGSDIALNLLLLATFFTFLNTLFSFSLVAMDKQKILLLINLIGVIFNIVANLLIIPKYGFVGAAYTTIFSEILIFISGLYALHKLINYHPQILKSLKIILAGLIMGIPVYYLQNITYQYLENLNILILIPIGVITYLFSLYILKAINHDDLKNFLKFD